mgnify:CR=1 FL=1
MAMSLTSPAFANGATIPRRHSCDGEDLSPALAWSGVPENARSLFLICEDPDAPGGVFRHWAAYNIPPDMTGLDESFSPHSQEAGIRQAVNDFGKVGYGGPCPPRRDKPHHYHFQLYALDAVLDDVPSSATCAEALRRAQPHVLETVELTGLYGRR